MMLDHCPTLQDIQDAHERITPHIHRTPILTNSTINKLANAYLYFKCENFQKIGAFKMRGATNAVLSLAPEQLQNGVATHSSGNHAQAVAKAAASVGAKAYIIMPSSAPRVKKSAVLDYGAEVIECAPTLEARETTLQATVDRTGATFIHPYDNWAVVAGQASCAKELIEDQPNLHNILAPVGGGGLLSGTALSAHYLAPHINVHAGEPEGADDAYRSFQTGELIPQTGPNTIADGLLTSLGTRTFEVIKKHVKSIITVNDEQIVAAMRLIWERMKIIIEPSCAVPLAAVLKEKEQFKHQHIGIILTGGNVDLAKLPF